MFAFAQEDAFPQCGTPFYMAPELWLQQKYNTKSDIYSLGCVLFQMLALRPPFNARCACSLSILLLMNCHH